MKRQALAVLVGLAVSASAFADVVVLASGASKHGHAVKLGDKTQREALAKSRPGNRPTATGSVTLTDNTGFDYFINTNITFATSSSASGAMSEASYTHAVAATTLNGGNVSSTLNDAFDGYNTLCVSLDGSTGTCQTGNSSYTIYNQLGAATLDAACSNRQVILPVQNVGGSLTVQRKVFVPSNDSFARWLNIFTNNGGSTINFNAIISNNLGSDSNTVIFGSSSGDAAAQTGDLWVGTFQNYSGTTSSDPRLAHVFGGTGAAVPLAGVSFANGDDNPFWSYALTLAPGETKIIANFATGQATKAAAAAKAAELATWSANTSQCMSTTEVAQVVNFAAAAAPHAAVPTLDRRVLAALAMLTVGLGLMALRPRQA